MSIEDEKRAWEEKVRQPSLGKAPERKREFKTIDDMKKAYAKYKEAAEKAGLKILLMGSPFGVVEDSVVVVDFGGDMDKWIKFFATAQYPWTAARTDFVLDW